MTTRPDPFRALGLEPRPDLTDDDVRAAWRRTAAATHPDRGDGGDPPAFAAAAAAYTALRTRFGRGEALADLAADTIQPVGPRSAGRSIRRARVRAHMARLGTGAAATLLGRARRGRPIRLVLRVLAAAAASAAAVAAAGPHPAAPALVTGTVTWLVRTARHDLAPPARSPDAAVSRARQARSLRDR